MGEKICVCLRRGECVSFCRVVVVSLVAWLCCVVYLILLPAKCGYACGVEWLVVICPISACCRQICGVGEVTGPLEGLLPAGNVVSGVYIVCALFEYKKWIFSVYIVYAFFYFLPACLPAGVCVWRKSVRI